MEKVIFNVQQRVTLGGNHPKRLRDERKVPGIVYGMDTENVAIEAELVPLEKLFYTAGEGTIIALSVGDKKPVDVIIQNVDFHPIKNEMTHIDFMTVDQNKKVHVTVPINFVGESEAVRLGGTLVINKSEIEIECLVKNLVHDLTADMSVLKEIGEHMSVGDITLPEGITIKLEDTVVIAHVEKPKIRVVETEESETAEGSGSEAQSAASSEEA